MRRDGIELAKPPGADLGEDYALERDCLPHHHVESADAVSCDQQDTVVVHRIDVADFSVPDPAQGQFARSHRRHWQSLRPA
jgi:hypothetical protein